MKQQIIDEFNQLKDTHPKYNSAVYRIYGPYQSKKDLRIRVVVYDGVKRLTVSYPKFIMECKLQRLLSDTEEVHHKNFLEFDDVISNLEVKSETEHGKVHSVLPEYFIYPICEMGFSLEGLKLSRMKHERKRFADMAGPFCSKSCAGKYRPVSAQKIADDILKEKFEK